MRRKREDLIAARTAAAEKFRIEYPEALPISAEVPRLRELWRSHPLIIVGGATGSGKTTQLPKVAMEIGCGRAGRIGCTQPRRLAATAMARRLAQELGCEYACGVGSQVRFEDNTKEETVLKFMTDGILLAEFRDDPLLEQYDALIIDEAHERTLNIDFLLGLLKNLLPRRPDLHVAISSATLDTERFSSFFPDAPVLSVEGRSFPIEDIYLPPYPDEELPETVARAVQELSARDPRGDILVFLPGEREIRDCGDMLTGRKLPRTEILPLYARLSAADQQKIFRPGSARRIILSTNVAETSLTIPRIKFCIDSALARISRYNPRTGIQELQVETISQASARQRRGRCGRISDGICVHLCSEEDLQRSDPYTDPELKRSSLAGVILQMAALNLPEIRHFPFLDPPQPQLIRDGLRTLTDIRAIHDSGRLTPDGRMLARLPLDPSLGKMILEASSRKVIPQLLVLTAALSVGEVLERPAEKQQAADDAHRKWKDEHSDFLAILRLWNDLAICDSNGILRKFCLKNFVSFRRAREWRNLVLDLADAIRYREKIGKVDISCEKNIHEAILCGIPRHLARYDRENGFYRGTDGKKFYLFPGSGLAGKKRRPPEWILCFQLVETSRIFGRTVAEIDPAAVERCAGHLCGYVYDQEHYEKQSGFVRAREKVVLGGLIVSAGRSVDFGRCNPAAAREIFIREGILEGLVRLPGSVVEKFNAAKADLLALEQKMRRPGALYEPEAAREFFFSRLPVDIHSVPGLKRYLFSLPEAMIFSKEELLAAGAVCPPASDFPDQLHLPGMKFPLSYLFAPGEEGDGVTLLVPETMLSFLPGRVLEYPVPGYYAEFGEALLRQLPKENRRLLGGIADAAAAFSDFLKEEKSLYSLSAGERMAEFLLLYADLEVDSKLFSRDKLPPFLRMQLGLLNDSGRLIERLDALPERVETTSRLAGNLPGSAAASNGKWEHWDSEIGVLPEKMEVPPHSGKFSFPALTDEKTFVGRALFLKLPEAKRRHNAGILRLFRLSHAQQEKFLKRSLRFSNALKLTMMLDTPQEEFAEALLVSALLSAGGGDLWQIRSSLQFDEVSRKMESSWAGECDRLLRFLEQCTGDISAIRAAAKRAGENAVPLEEHLELLFAPGFLRRPALLTDYPRFLRALKIRSERLLNSPAKDRAKGEVLEAWLDRFYAALQTLDDLTDSDALYHFWLLLEECRIAIFAPEVRPAVRAPLALLESEWRELRF